jgi:NADH-quinone oxidoreductase subunit E
MGGDVIMQRLKDHLDVGNDETTEDGMVTLEHIECNAACDYAPVMMVNWEFFDNQTPQSAVALVDDLRNGNEVKPTRGPRLCTFTEVSRVLAGFPDGLADEGPSAGPATLVGLRLAHERGDKAPAPERSAGPSGTPEPAPAATAPAPEPGSAPAAAPETSGGGKATRKKTGKRHAVPPVSLAGNASAEVRSAGAESSSNDAGVSTAQSDPANEAAPAEDHE